MTRQRPPSPAEAQRHGVTASFFVVVPDRRELGRIARLIDEGALRVAVAATFPLSRGREAFESGATFRRAPGKTVLVVGDGAARS